MSSAQVRLLASRLTLEEKAALCIGAGFHQGQRPALRIGTGVGDECRALDVDVLLGPGINMKRSPLCGRNFEYFSEDPLLAGALSASLIQGV